MSRANDTPCRNLRAGRIALGLALVALLASAPAAAEPANDATPPAEPQAKPQDVAAKTGTAPEDVSELPVLLRFEIPIEKGQALFDDVKDKTFGFDESAFYYLVSLVNRFPAELFKPDEEPVAYAQLVATPSAFRGTPVTIRGVYASVAPWRPGAALGLDVPRLFTCNIQEHPAGKNQPFATVVVIDDPTVRFKRGNDVIIKAYFYKVRKDENQEGNVRLGPLLVGRRFEEDVWGPSPLGSQSEGSPLVTLGPYGPVAIFMGAALVIMLVAFIFIKRMGKVKSDAKRGHLSHRIRLRRPDRPAPFEGGGTGGESGSADSESRPD